MSHVKNKKLEDRVQALLHQLGMESASITQACADVRKGGMAILLVVVAAEQIHAYFRPASWPA
jgi:hypothetical protein